jgi:hypothetical protein
LVTCLFPFEANNYAEGYIGGVVLLYMQSVKVTSFTEHIPHQQNSGRLGEDLGFRLY